MSPRVLLATRLFPPEVGAAAFRLQALVAALHRTGASVRVLTTVPPTEHCAEKGISRWPVLRDRGGNVRGYVQYLSFDLPLFFRLLFSRADVVVCEPPPTTGLMVTLSSFLRRRPYVYYAADVWTDAVIAMGAPRPVVSIMGWIEGVALRNASHILAISDGVAAQLPQFRVHPDRVSVVGNGIDTDTFGANGPRERPGHPYFIYTGTMSEWQGAEVFIEALQLLKDRADLRLYFFGQGAAEKSLRELSDRLVPGRVIFGGVKPPEETASWIRGAVGALVSIVPGQGYDFAKPTKVYAAAACGVPVIYAGAGDCALMVAENNLGESVTYAASEVADAMRRMLDTPDSAREKRINWVNKNASLRVAGERAAAAVLAAARS